MRQLLDEKYPKFTPGHRTQNSGQIWPFAHRMSPGDWVAVPSKRKTIHIGEITGSYEHAPTGPDPYYHFRNVNWLETDIPRTSFDKDILNSLGAVTTICGIKRNDAETRVPAMQANNWRSAGIKPKITAVACENDTTDEIARLIYSKYSGHGLETLVEAILNAQGFTTHHSDKGADVGIDILAAPGILGFGEPRIRVQVKSQDTPLERQVLDQLVGTMQHVGAKQGLLVCWGGFKKTVKHELPRLLFKVRLWDQNDLIDHFLAHYDRFDEDLRAEIPLKRIWAVASPDDEQQG